MAGGRIWYARLTASDSIEGSPGPGSGAGGRTPADAGRPAPSHKEGKGERVVTSPHALPGTWPPPPLCSRPVGVILRTHINEPKPDKVIWGPLTRRRSHVFLYRASSGRNQCLNGYTFAPILHLFGLPGEGQRMPAAGRWVTAGGGPTKIISRLGCRMLRPTELQPRIRKWSF